MKKFAIVCLMVVIFMIGIDYAFFRNAIEAKTTIVTLNDRLKSVMLDDTTIVKEKEVEVVADTTYEYETTGTSSWYGSNGVPGIKRTDSYHGKQTASGEIFDTWALTCAYNNRSYIKRGQLLRVTNIANGKSVIVKVNDSGAFNKLNRVIDLSYKAKQELGMGDLGKVKVEKVIIK